MRVKGPPPTQGVHIAKAVQEGMRAMFRGVASPGTRSETSHSDTSTVPPAEDSMNYEASEPSLLEEYVKVEGLASAALRK